MGTQQAKIQDETNPAKRFFEAIQSAVSSGKAHLSSPGGKCPENAVAFGWRFTSYGLSDDWRPHGERIGWVNNEEVLLDPTSAYKVVQDIISNQLGISQRGLRKLLVNEGFIVPDTTRKTTTVRRKLNGTQRDVLLLSNNVFDQHETEELEYATDETLI